MRRFNCPSCDAKLTIEEDNRDFAFCNYCGAKIMLDDYRSTHHQISEQRYINETEIYKIEAEKELKLKQMEIAQKEKENKRRIVKKGLKVCLGILVIGIILLVIGMIISHFAPGSNDWNGLTQAGALILFLDICAILVLGSIYYNP